MLLTYAICVLTPWTGARCVRRISHVCNAKVDILLIHQADAKTAVLYFQDVNIVLTLLLACPVKSTSI
jgi:hypothetical protein